jgi:Family of unknown function (DUF5317)
VLFLVAIVLGIAAGLAVGGRLSNLAGLRFHWPWLVPLALVAREVVLVTPLNRIAGTQYIYLLALLALLAWTVWNLNRVPVVWIVTAGTLLNVIVVAANGGRMPVAPQLAGVLATRGAVGQYIVMGSTTQLSFLGDWIPMLGAPSAVSVGDLLIAFGLALSLLIATATPARIVS